MHNKPGWWGTTTYRPHKLFTMKTMMHVSQFQQTERHSAFLSVIIPRHSNEFLCLVPMRCGSWCEEAYQPHTVTHVLSHKKTMSCNGWVCNLTAGDKTWAVSCFFMLKWPWFRNLKEHLKSDFASCPEDMSPVSVVYEPAEAGREGVGGVGGWGLGDKCHRGTWSIPTIVWVRSSWSSLHVLSAGFLTNSTRLTNNSWQDSSVTKTQRPPGYLDNTVHKRYVTWSWYNVKSPWYSGSVTLKAT